jgi:hypothetical protein
MAFAMGVGAHRLVQPVHGHAPERPVTDRQRGTHYRLPTRTSLFYLWIKRRPAAIDKWAAVDRARPSASRLDLALVPDQNQTADTGAGPL